MERNGEIFAHLEGHQLGVMMHCASEKDQIVL